MSAADNNPLSPILDDDVTLDPTALAYVNSPEFERKCTEIALERAASTPDGFSNKEDDLWSSSDESDSSATTIDVDPHEPSRLEQLLYYAGIRGPKTRGPKLIWRDSQDKFDAPSGPEAYTRRMRLIPVQDDHELGDKVGEGILWDVVRKHIVGLLNEKDVKTSAVDFVRFTWLNQRPGQVIDDDKEEEEEGDDAEVEIFDVSEYDKIAAITLVEDGDRFVSNPTVWIGVLPDSLTATGAHDVAKEIRDYLNGLQLENIDIAFREKKFKFLAGTALYRPVEEGDALQPVIDDVSVALSLSIQGFKTSMQGTLGLYFRVDKKLYAITVRHNLFPLDDDNAEYRFNPSAPKKEVLVMGDIAFTNYKASIQAHIGMLLDTVKSLKKRIDAYKRKVEDVVDVDQSKVILQENEVELSKTERHINELKRFFLIIDKRWGKRKDRVIGHVVWAPPIATGQAPHNYTCDLCVVELNKDKFRNLMGNVLCLGTKYTESKLLSLIYGRDNVSSEFKFPDNGLLHLRRILTADEVKHPNSKDTQGDPIRRVLKDGYKTGLTVGGLGKFMSFVRRYFPTGHQESVELPIFNHEDEPGTFSKGGDSGSLIVDILGRFVALLIGGSNKGTDGSDITYATLFEWVWDLVCKEFPGADLYFEDLVAFFANND